MSASTTTPSTSGAASSTGSGSDSTGAGAAAAAPPTDQLERAGGLEYLSTLMDGLPRALNVAQYARIVKEKSSLRNLISSANAIITEAIGGEDETDEIIDQAERRIFEIAAESAGVMSSFRAPACFAPRTRSEPAPGSE